MGRRVLFLVIGASGTHETLVKSNLFKVTGVK